MFRGKKLLIISSFWSWSWFSPIVNHNSYTNDVTFNLNETLPSLNFWHLLISALAHPSAGYCGPTMEIARRWVISRLPDQGNWLVLTSIPHHSICNNFTWTNNVPFGTVEKTAVSNGGRSSCSSSSAKTARRLCRFFVPYGPLFDGSCETATCIAASISTPTTNTRSRKRSGRKSNESVLHQRSATSNQSRRILLSSCYTTSI